MTQGFNGLHGGGVPGDAGRTGPNGGPPNNPGEGERATQREGGPPDDAFFGRAKFFLSLSLLDSGTTAFSIARLRRSALVGDVSLAL